MSEYFVVTNSFAAPFFSDTDDGFVEADSPKDALEKTARDYRHPAGLYAAACYRSADAYHKGERPLARWLSNRARYIARVKHSSIYSESAEHVRLDGVDHTIADPYGGAVATEEE